MNIKELQLLNKRFQDEYEEQDTQLVALPAAALWVIQPQPPEALVQAYREKVATIHNGQSKTPPPKYYLGMKKQEESAKKPSVNNYVSKKSTKICFQSAMRVLLTCGQVFGVIPVLGINEMDATKMRFKYISWRFLYTTFSFCLQLTNVGFVINRFFKMSLTLDSATTVIFYTTTCLCLALFASVAKKWPELAKSIAKSEYVDPCTDQFLIRRCNFTCLLVLSMALLEHMLSAMAGFAVSMDCSPEVGLYEAYIEHAFPWIFSIIKYNFFFGFLGQFSNFESTFNWNFADLFIIVISHYLTSRFDQINKKIYAVRGKYLSNVFWKATREDYCRVTTVVRAVDDVISSIVFISFANNLYFVCQQMFHTLEPLGGHEHAVYFVFSFVFLVSRSLAVSIYAARVHSSAKMPAAVLYDVPTSTYSIEVQRFLDQVTGDNVALSGLRFFNVTRGLVLTVAGTIVTYELVLVQFNTNGASIQPSSLTPTTTAVPNTTALPVPLHG